MLRILLLLVSLTAFLPTSELFAQCNEPEAPGTDCESAPILCDFDLEGYCSNNPPSSNGIAPPGFCATALDNVQWIAFVAGSVNLQLTINVSECQGSNNPPGGGIQAQLFGQTSDCNGFFPVSNCHNSGQSNGNAVLTTNVDLVIGNIYYFIVDGWAFDQCLWEVTVTQGNVTPPDLTVPGPIQGPLNPCPGLITSYSIPPSVGANNYEWTIDCGTILAGQGTTSITVQLDGNGPCQVCVEAQAPCSDNSSACLDINVEPIPDTFIDSTICQGDLVFWCGNLETTSGSYPCTFQTPIGCDSTVWLDLTVAFPTYGQIELELCENESQTINTPAGPFTFSGAGGPTSAELFFPGANAQGCDSFLTVIVNVEYVDFIATVLDESCAGNQDGSILLTPILGTPPFTYDWDENSLDGAQNPTNLPPGIYTVTVTSSLGCTASQSIEVGGPDPVEITVEEVIDVSCPGESDGSITISATGGSVALLYFWSDPNIGNSPNANDLAAGTYTITVQDVFGCSAEETIEVNEPEDLVINVLEANDIACNGETNGSILIETTGGTAPYSYAWDPSSIGDTDNPTGLAAGTYSVTATDDEGCTTEASIDIAEPGAINGTITPAALDCNGDSSGSIDVEVSGGTPGFSFAWSDPGIGDVEDPTGLAAGNYTVTVTDASGCTIELSTTITEPALLQITANGTDLSCNGNGSGSISTIRTGGTSPFTYAWSDPGIGGIANPVGLDAGAYSVTVTDGNGCTAEASVTLNEPPLLEISVDNTTDISCNGANDGSINVSSTGGVTPYVYSWNLSSIGNNPNPTGLAPGTYQVTVTDANNCTAVASASLTEPPVLSATATPTNLACNADGSGSIDVTVTGGTPGYSYAWSDANIGNVEDPTGLAAGAYTVTVTDDNGCTVEVSATVTQPTALVVNVVGNDLDCNGDNTGSVNVITSGGTSPYTYAWNVAGIGNNDNPTGLAAGFYEVTVTDNNGCTGLDSITLTEPQLLEVSLASTDVSCFGGADGQIDATVTGGTTPYTFSWSDPGIGNNEDATGLTIGTYDLLVTDANGCTAEVSATLTEPTALTISGTSTDATCGDSNGTIDLTVGGGVAPYSYNWSDDNLDGQEDPINLSPGTYTVTVTDDNGCTIIESVAVNTPTGLTANALAASVSCNGGDDGSIDLTISGGIAPYIITWNDPAYNGTEDPDSLVAGIYNVTVEDADGCSVTASATVNEPPVLNVTGTSVKATCGEPNGSIDLTITGGTAPYTIDWSVDTLDGIQDPGGLLPGMYDVEIIDDNGCTASTSVEVTAPDELLASAVITDVECFGESTGAIDVTVSGGTTPYTFTWNNILFSGQEDISGVAAGNYSLTVTDADGCTVVVNDTVTEPAELLVTPSSTNVNCNGAADGTISLDVTGGTAPYSFDWNNNNLDGIEDPVDLGPGTYNVTITDDNGCTTTTSAAITQPPVLQVFGSTVPAVCGEPNGSIDMTIQGGVAPYTIVWSDSTLNGIEDPMGLLPNIYTVTVQDANGCEVVENFNVNTPNALVVTAVVSDVDCFGASTGGIDVTITGGTPPYLLDWSDNTYDSQQDVIDAPAGDYQLIVTDNDGCSVTINQTIAQPTALVADLIPSDVVCNNADDGSVDLTVSGGVAPYSFAWNDPAYDGQEDPSGLAPGNYEVTVTDDNGCTIVVDTDVNEPEALAVSDVVTDADCNDAATGSVDVTVTGGIAPYSYDWDDDTYDGIEDPAGLNAGTYQVIVTDANNCTITYSVTVDEPAALAVDNVNITNVDCNGNSTGSAELTVSGGVKPYTINWSNGAVGVFASSLAAGDYDATITDANGCELITNTITVDEPLALSAQGTSLQATCGLANGSIDLIVTGGTTPYDFDWSNNAVDGQEDPQNLLAGDYSVTVSDANGCTTTASVTVNTPPTLEASSVPAPTSCFDGADGSISVDVTGGTAPYTYDWDDDAFDGFEDPTGMSAGSYTLTVTDSDGCTVITSAEITQPTEIVISSSFTQATCGEPNGSISLTVNGGTSPYSFDWDDDTLDGEEDPQDLLAGTYSVIVTDDNGCTAEISVTVSTPTQLEASIDGTDADCFGDNSGSIQVDVTGGTAPFAYDWNDNSLDGTEDPAQVTAGDYSLTVTDADGCSVVVSIAIDEPELLEASGTPSAVSCNGGSDGSIDLTVSGGVAPYSYQWNNGAAPVEDPANLSANVYSATVTDANGCTATAIVNITQPSAIALSAVPEDARCEGNADGSVDLTVSGGTAPYTYEWTNGAGTDEDPQGLFAGTYNVEVTDANGCTATLSTEINEPEGLDIEIAISSFGNFNVSCYDSEDGFADATVTGGTPPYSFSWNNGGTTSRIENIPPGTYEVTVTDAEGCTADTETKLSAPPAISATLLSEPVTCFGDEDGAIFVENLTGGIPPYRYVLNGGESESGFPAFGFLEAGAYDIEVFDSEGCSWASGITVEEPAELTVDLGEDILLILGESTDLTAQVSDPFNLEIISWSGPLDSFDLESLVQTVAPFETTDYGITVIDSSGCVASDEIRVRVDKQRPIFIPTAFSPNGDGFNDKFFIGGGDNVVQIDDFVVFDRWGETLFRIQNFQPNDEANGWDGTFNGKEMNPGVYVYFAEVTFIDGEVVIYKGSVTLVR